MRGAIVVIMAILGVVLVLTGVAALWGSAVGPSRTEGSTGRFERGLAVAGQLPAPGVLIKWGVVLLTISAIAAGAISFSVTASAGTS